MVECKESHWVSLSNSRVVRVGTGDGKKSRYLLVRKAGRQAAQPFCSEHEDQLGPSCEQLVKQRRIHLRVK